MYIFRSPQPIPRVNQFPHTHSTETETHIYFIPKMVKSFDLLGFSRQKTDCLHIPLNFDFILHSESMQ